MDQKLIFMVVIVCFVLFTFVNRLEATDDGWTDPLLLTELNSPSALQPAMHPYLTDDQLNIYFTRLTAQNLRKIYHASRNTINEPFGNERVLSEIFNGRNQYLPYITTDGLRLYYSQWITSSKSTVITMASRPNTSAAWTETIRFWDIHVGYESDHVGCLSEDELTLYYFTTRGQADNTYAIWQATRSSTAEQFQSPTPISELNTGVVSRGPHLTADGLTVYFSAIRDGRSTLDIYKATRDSEIDAFGNIERLPVNRDDLEEYTPYISPDSQTLYFSRKTWGIMKSNYQKPEPIEVIVDIKPGSSPNPLNVKSKGMLPVAVLGTGDFNVESIDVVSIRLAGVAAIRHGYQDVNEDGFIDLELKFKNQEIVGTLSEVEPKDILTLKLEGVLTDGNPIAGSDTVKIVGKYKPFNPADINKDGVVDLKDFAVITKNWLQTSIIDN